MRFWTESRIGCSGTCWLLAVFFLTALVMSDESASEGDERAEDATAGARDSAEQDPDIAPITDYERDHWSFLPLRRPTPPEVSDSAWPRAPIDYFVLAKLESRKLTPMPETDRESLLRRVCFDLLGLPPSPRLIDSFLNDDSPDAYGRIVDSLLASPRYGERWGQHWLDLARFAETDGFEHDLVRPEAWKYRDWVISALNEDLPYDRFIRMQIAGDELPGADAEATVATGFCLSGPDMPDINSQEERKHNLLNEMTATVGSVFMGLQLGCAQCHDHKFDPITQADFYRLRAVFQPAVSVRKNKSVDFLSEQSGRAKASYLMVRGDWRRQGPEVEPGVPRITTFETDYGLSVSASREQETTGRRSALADRLTDERHPLVARAMANRLWQYHFGEGLSRTPSDFGIMGDEPVHGELLDWLATELIRRRWSLKSMHRLIVTSATYRQASHCDRVAQGHAPDAELRARYSRNVSEDPENRLWSRFPVRRLEGEVIRDAMLSISGLINFEQGGPGVMAPLPPELKRTLLKNQWKVSEDESQHYRRGVYMFARRNLRYPIFDVFDRPDANASCAGRSESTTATQALLMLNSEPSLDVARGLAGRVLTTAEGDPGEAIDVAVRLALGRFPRAEERREFREFLASQEAYLADEGRSAEQLALPRPMPSNLSPHAAAAVVDFCLALLNSNEFIYVD